MIKYKFNTVKIPVNPIIVFRIVNREIINYLLLYLISKGFKLKDIKIESSNKLEKGNI